MTAKEKAINVLENEVLCVQRQMEEGCDRDCAKCHLSLADGEIIPAYEMAIAALSAQQEPISPCAACGYGGKYLDAPPCTECPAHPKEAEKNETLTLEKVAFSYLEICEEECRGDFSVGIPSCEFYLEPDVDVDSGRAIPGGCLLKAYLHTPKKAESCEPCDFCKRYDFGNVKAKVDKYEAYLSFSGGSRRFPPEERFNFCPVCGRALKRLSQKEAHDG